MPGFYGTVLGLFTGIGTDSSAQSRTGSYGLAWSFIARAPVFGRGVGTFLPPYRILDNQYLGSLIELGFVGLICLLLLFGAGVHASWQVRRLPGVGERMPMGDATGATDGGKGGDARADSLMLASALTAATLGGVVSFAFFDAWGFPMIPSILFLLLGCAGALRRLVLEGDLPAMGLAVAPSRGADRLAEGRVAENLAVVGDGKLR
jgi:O-antigen ligase